MTKTSVPARARGNLLRGTSALTLMIAAATSAGAQCAPDPTVAGGTTTCTGVDPDGLLISTVNTTVNVATGTTVSASATPALTIEAPVSFSNTETVNVSGQVQGNGTAGILLYNGLPSGFTFGPTTNLALTVAAGGSVSGSSAVVLAQSTGNTSGVAVARIDNSGTLSGTSGIALSASNAATGGFASIVNRVGATILGTVVGPIGTLTNAGTIDGGAGSAIEVPGTYNFFVGAGSWTNTGTITSSASAATVRNDQSTGSITNGGTISNTGGGAAMSGNNLVVTNQTGGQISAVGGSAIAATNYITLTNAGAISGDVTVSSSASGFSTGSIIDSTAGSILGNVSLDAGNDIVVARYVGSRTLATGVTGTIDGGAGLDTVRVRFDATATVTTPIDILPNFERLGIAPAAGVTVTLGEAFVAPSVELTGSGTIINRGTIQGAGQVLVADSFLSSPRFVNEGSIVSTAPVGAQYSVGLSGLNSFANRGVISAAGDGMFFSSQGTFANSGTISATGTGLSLSGPNFDNSGTIRSSGGTAMILTGSSGGTSRTNSGLIDGATIGVNLSTDLVNTGRITSGGTGVQLQSYGQIDNRAGGVISGTAMAIGPAAGAYLYNARVLNAGTITGDVSIATAFTSGDSSYNIFYALPGGVLDGNLNLGSRGTLVTEIVNTGPGQFAGITGTVTATDSDLVYRVRSDATAVHSSISGFGLIGYELSDGAKLTLTASGSAAPPVRFAGTGTVDLTADITTTSQPAISATGLRVGSGYGGASNALAVISRGVVSLTRGPQDLFPYAAVSFGAGDTFTNAGIITVRDEVATIYNPIAAIAGGSVVNSGTINLSAAIGVMSASNVNNSGSIVQLADGRAAVGVRDAATVVNSGTIRVDGVGVGISDYFYGETSVTNAAGGVIAGGSAAIRIYRGTVDNSGTIDGDVLFTAFGNDTFIQRGAGTVSGIVDGGFGTDAFIVDATGNGAVNGDRILNFESVTQTGTGTGTYEGTFTARTVNLTGGTMAVAAGQTLATHGPVTITGGNAGVGVSNAGTIAGAILLGTGNDNVANIGTISGSVTLGAGDDSFTEGPASSVSGAIDGGTGIDIYRVRLAGSRNGIAARSNFERLAVEGSGTLSLTLDQDYQAVMLDGTGLNLVLAGRAVGSVTGGSGADSMIVDGDLASVSLGGGDDLLAIGARVAGGRYDGGGGADALRFTTNDAVTLTGSATGFETVALAGDALTIAGTLGSQDAPLAFSGNRPKAVTVASGATLAGVIDLGAGNDTFTLAAGARLLGSLSGGGGTNSATVTLAEDTSLGALSNFQTVTFQGSGGLTFTGTSTALDRVTAPGDVTIVQGASLSVSQLAFGAGNDRLAIAGGFAGSVDGGAGTDTIDVFGGSVASPVAFGSIANVESMRMGGGYATISGAAAVNGLALTGGRLIGLSGSTITAPTINVGAGSTFGSAGTVNGNIAVAGTLSPGASPGTMTVNGNVSLASGSISLFEITPTVSDRLVVNGALTIAQGTTLQLVADQAIAPGRSLELVVTSGGITGSFTNVVKPASLFGLVVQDANRILLLGQFLNDAAFTPQVRRSIAYVNDLLTSGRGSTALLAAVPRLASAGGTSDQAAFALLTPETYASARQVTVEHGLQLADTGRSAAFAPRNEAQGLFTFGNMLAGARTLDSGSQGTSRAHMSGYGILGGLGWSGGTWSLGAFAGYVDSRQTMATRGARTTADGAVAGVHGRWAGSGFGVKATIAYDGSRAATRRVLPDGLATARYDLHGWTGDISLDYAAPVSGNWVIRPSVGATAIRTIRGGVTEGGASAFALGLQRDKGRAVFVDGMMTFTGGMREAATVRPYLSIGLRYQVEGQTPYALAAFGGGGFGLEAAGARRAPVLATTGLGADVVLSSRLALFGALGGEVGNADRRYSARAGARWAF